jgi:hypothetical protein
MTQDTLLALQRDVVLLPAIDPILQAVQSFVVAGYLVFEKDSNWFIRM